MAQLFNDAARSTLAALIGAGDTSLTLASGGSLFPVANTGAAAIGPGADWFKVVLQDASGVEIVYVRTHTSGSTTFSDLIRGQEGTSARSFAAASVVGLRVTSEDMRGLTLHVGSSGAAHLAATTSVAGFMSAADKSKLDGVAAGATANAGTVTGVTGTAPIVSSGGAAPAISISAATISAAGSMSAADKTKLDGVATGATANVGTVTTASVVSANGFAGTVATAGTTPAITLTTSIAGVLKGASSALAAATAGTDFVAPGTSTAFTSPQRPSLSAETAPTTNALTWDLTVNSVMRINLSANITTLTLTGTLSTLAGYQYQAVVRYSGGTAITWPASVKFAGGTAPTLTGTSGKVDIFNFMVASNNGGTTFFLLCTGSSQNL